jgi:hypothetical protein
VGPAGRSLTLASLVSLSALVGCGEDRAEALPEVVAPPPLPRAARREAPPPLYGPDGALLESDVVVAGLTLPRGLTPLIVEERRHVYRSDVPLFKMQQYFGVRLVTGEVDARSGGGATYRSALPRDVEGGAVRLDVSVQPSSSAATRVEIVELLPPPVDPPSEQETLERLRRAMEAAE